MSFNLSSSGGKQVQNKLNVVQRGIKNPKIPLKRIGIKLLNLVNKNFQTESNDGEGWEPLSENAIARKGSSRILVDTGNLRASFLFELRGNDTVVVGSPVFYSEFHEFGDGNLPQRKMLPKPQKAIQVAKQEMRQYLVELTRK